MSIQWSLTLSDKQIAILNFFSKDEDRCRRAIAQIAAGPKEIKRFEEVDKGPGIREVMDDMTHYVTHVRALAREGLVTYEIHKYGPALQYHFNAHFLTEKGWYVLRIVEIDMEETRKQLSALAESATVVERKKLRGRS